MVSTHCAMGGFGKLTNVRNEAVPAPHNTERRGASINPHQFAQTSYTITYHVNGFILKGGKWHLFSEAV